MKRTILDQRTLLMIPQLHLLVQALNTFQKIIDQQGDLLPDDPDEPSEADETAIEFAKEAHHDLWIKISELATEYNLETRFNRLTGEVVLLDQQ